MILGSQAKLENDNRGINVKRGLRTRVEMGFWPGMAPLGYINQKRMDKKCQIVPDPDRAPSSRKCLRKCVTKSGAVEKYTTGYDSI
jgi:DNA invertase Pin-like site-specific DNA recombinase